MTGPLSRHDGEPATGRGSVFLPAGPAALPSERRVAARRRVEDDGLIALDEHTSLACIVYDLSRDGVRIVSLDAEAVPQTFLLTSRLLPGGRVCSVVWRNAEEIGACFASA